MNDVQVTKSYALCAFVVFDDFVYGLVSWTRVAFLLLRHVFLGRTLLGFWKKKAGKVPESDWPRLVDRKRLRLRVLPRRRT